MVRRSRWRVIALALSLALGVFTLETAVHSVHHLVDQEAGATCPVLSATQDLSWGAVEVPAIGAPASCVTAAPLARAEEAPRWQIYRSHPGRAPPA